jgi:hypothetical protein
MIGAVISYLALAAGAAGGDPADEICAAALAACEPQAAIARVADAPAADYATPAKVVCAALDLARGRGGRADGGQAAAWACDQVVLDMWYRMSRTPDSERYSGGLLPSGAPRPRGPSAACGAPPEKTRAPVTSGVGLQPLAIFAVPALAPSSGRSLSIELDAEMATRADDPPERPPRRGR